MVHKVGIIGLGIMGQRMIYNMVRHPKFELTAIWDKNLSACKKIKEAHPDVHLAQSAEELVEEASLDLIYIATPPSTHIPYIRLAMEKDKALFCEKPLAVDLEDSRKLIQDIKKQGLKNAINFPFATDPAVLTLEQHLQKGLHGQAKMLEIRFHFSEWPRTWQKGAASWLAKREEGGFLREVFSHFAYLTERLLGDIIIEHAQVSFPKNKVDAETYIMANLSSNGIPIQMAGGVGGCAPDYNEWTLYGTERSYRLYDWQQLKVADKGRWYDLMPEVKRLEGLEGQLNELSEMLLGHSHQLPSFESGLKIQEVVESLLLQ